MSLITVSNIYKACNEYLLLKDVSFTQKLQQNIAIAGETGSGKTTLMKIVAGLGQADSGEVFFEQKKVKGINEKLMPGHPGIAYLSQHFELSNNYRVEEILAYANKLTSQEGEQLFAVCRIDHLLQRKTNTLSGGEKQRVALARLLTLSPRLLLLDEPFSNMDLIHKGILKQVVHDVRQRLGVTCMLISHDPNDILPWADEILVMRQGEIIQKGSPQHIYSHPHTEYTAGLFGKYNILIPEITEALGMANNTSKYIRPEDIVITTDESAGLKGIITDIGWFGSYYEITVSAIGQDITVKTDKDGIKNDDIVYLNRKRDNENTF